MKRVYKELLLIIIVASLFSMPLFFRTQPLGIDDPYYFFNHVFEKSDYFSETTTFAKVLIFDQLPANVTLINIILIINFLISLIIFYYIVRMYSSRYAYLVVIAFSVFLFFSGVFLRLEDDAFAIPFMLMSLFFIIRYQLKKNFYVTFFRNRLHKILYFDNNIILSLLFLFISVNIWRFTIYLIPIFLIMTYFEKLYVIATISILPFFYKLFFNILPSSTYQEYMPLNAITPIFFLIPIYFFIKDKYTRIAVFILTIFSLLANKYVLLLIPILFINLATLLEQNKVKYTQNILIYLVVIFFIAGTLTIYNGMPSNKQDELFDITQQLDKTVNIDWSFGYFAIWKNIEGVPYKTKENVYKNYVLTFKNNKNIENCEKIKEEGEIGLYFCR